MSIKSQFCPRCGEEKEKLYEGLCSNCYAETQKPNIPRQSSVRLCPVCKSIYVRNIWIKAVKLPEEYLERKIKEKIKLGPIEKLKKVKLVKTGKEGELRVTTEIDDRKIERTRKGEYIVDKYACPECSRQFKTSITAILQLRTKRNVEQFIADILSMMGRDKSKIAKAEEKLHGIDFSFGDKRTARVLARKIKDRFNCTMKESVKQRGWDKQKNRPLVQVTYILRQQ